MTSVIEDVQPWSRLRWAATITIVVGIQLGLTLIFSNPPAIPPRSAANTQVTLPEGMTPELQILTDPTLLALGGPHSFSAIWLELPELQPLPTDWEQPPQWLGLQSDALGERFLAFAQSNAGTSAGLAFKTRPQTVPAKPRVIPKPLKTESTLHVTGDLAGRAILSKPNLPSWPAKDFLLPSTVRVVVDARGFVTSAILQSGSGSVTADELAVTLAKQVRLSPVIHTAGIMPLTLGQLLFEWQTKPVTDTGAPTKKK